MNQESVLRAISMSDWKQFASSGSFEDEVSKWEFVVSKQGSYGKKFVTKEIYSKTE